MPETHHNGYNYQLLLQPPCWTQNCSIPYHINRMLSLSPTAERQQIECETIQTWARNNNFPVKLTTNLKTRMQHKTQPNMIKDENRKWVPFTYYSPKNRKLTKLFQQTNINISFKSTNTTMHQTQETGQKPGIQFEWNIQTNM